jgi:hypothetical protein
MFSWLHLQRSPTIIRLNTSVLIHCQNCRNSAYTITASLLAQQIKKMVQISCDLSALHDLVLELRSLLRMNSSLYFLIPPMRIDETGLIALSCVAMAPECVKNGCLQPMMEWGQLPPTSPSMTILDNWAKRIFAMIVLRVLPLL